MKHSTRKITALYAIARVLLAIPLRLLCRVKVTGKEHVPLEGGCLVCPNHYSNMDAVLLGAVFPPKCQPYCIAKGELFRTPVVRSLVSGLGAIKVERNQSNVGALKAGMRMIENGQILVLFPQGKRCFGENPADTVARPGAGMIATHCKCPVLPVCIKTKGMRFRLCKRTEIIIGEPISPETICELSKEGKSYAEITNFIFDKVCSLGNFSPSSALQQESLS